jgi:hypothetical protein
VGQAKVREMKESAAAEAEVWPREIELTVAERLWLSNILPREGDITSLRILRDFREDLSFSEEENERMKVIAVAGNVQWDAAKATPKILSLGRKAWSMAKEKLIELEKQHKLNVDCLSLYEKFVEEKQPES